MTDAPAYLGNPHDSSINDWRWSQIRVLLGIPFGWTLRAQEHEGYWTLTATGPRPAGTRWQACMDDLRCCRNDGHEGDHLYPDGVPA